MYIKVKVLPGAKKEIFRQVDTTVFEIATKEPAERNLANKRVVELIARHYGISEGGVRIVTGHRSQSKILDVPLLDN